MMKQKKQPSILWQRGALWLAFLGPFFFLGYGWLNHLTSTRADVGVMVQDWERAIPFVPWMMLPYMSIDAFYAVSLFLFRKRSALDRHAFRLLLATVISLIGFWLYPLQFSFVVPKAEGFNGFLQTVLLGFDKPYNQAPSLHISLLIVLWVAYAKRLQGFWRMALHGWFFAIAASVLLVYQHHFIDVWTGALAGVACLYFIPDRPFFWYKKIPSHCTIILAWRYAIGAALGFVAGLYLKPYSSLITLLLVWIAIALALVAAAYIGFEKQVFQRHKGFIRWPARIMLAPYLLGSWLSYCLYTRKNRQPVEVKNGVWLGPFPDKHMCQMGWGAVLDMTNEFATTPIKKIALHNFLPVMDLTPAPPKMLVKAVRWIETAHQELRYKGSDNAILVHCALGLSRSASVVVCWLVWRKHAASVQAAIAYVKTLRPGLVLSTIHIQNIQYALSILDESCSKDDDNFNP
ncbi:MAG TPA: phosphatase PAP2/dual specificity phosphatase family protein [Methylotenera sp.]|nr:phosphatase PAP2/dual specificity phosphatase family protein [Methylotenera sp.]